MESLITCIKNRGSADCRYFAVGASASGICISEFGSSVSLELGELVESGDEVKTPREGELTPKKLEERIRGEAERIVVKKPQSSGIKDADEITARMWGRLASASGLLIKKLMLCAPIIVRFHNDADGSSGAYGLFKSLSELAERRPELSYRHNITWIMQGSVSYDGQDASSDIMITNNYSSLERPLLLMIDFGTSEESNPAIKAVREKFDLIWLDHHPVMDGFDGKSLENYINPWQYGGDSNYTAGFLACVFSKTFSKLETKEIENASFIGDYSEYVNPTRESKELSMILDLITSDVEVAFGPSSPNLTPFEIEKLINDKQKYRELIDYAEMRLSEALESALKSVKVYKTEAANIYMLDYEGIRIENTKFPLPGRFASKLLSKINELNDRPCIVGVHFGRYISMRTSKELNGKVDLSKIINELKGRHRDYVLAGGGHRNAAGIKLANDTQKSAVVKEIVALIKEQLAAA